MTLEELNQATITVKIEGIPVPTVIYPGTPVHDELVAMICSYVSEDELADGGLAVLSVRPTRVFKPLSFALMAGR
jgi:hypothetical protein